MKRFLFVCMVCLLVAVPAWAVKTVEFAGGVGANFSGWSYDAATRTLSFGKIPVVGAVGDVVDPLVGSAYVDVPDMVVGGTPGNWTLPGGAIYIRQSSDDLALMTGTLNIGNLNTLGITGVAYPMFRADVVVTSVDNVVGSPVLDKIDIVGMLDFEVTISGGDDFSGDDDFNQMLQEKTGSWGDGISGSLTTVPAPGAVLLVTIGSSLVGWLRRRRVL